MQSVSVVQWGERLHVGPASSQRPVGAAPRARCLPLTGMTCDRWEDSRSGSDEPAPCPVILLLGRDFRSGSGAEW